MLAAGSVAEAAREAGAVPLLTRLLKQQGRLGGSEEALDNAAAVVAACNGPGAVGGKVRAAGGRVHLGARAQSAHALSGLNAHALTTRTPSCAAAHLHVPRGACGGA